MLCNMEVVKTVQQIVCSVHLRTNVQYVLKVNLCSPILQEPTAPTLAQLMKLHI